MLELQLSLTEAEVSLEGNEEKNYCAGLGHIHVDLWASHL